MRVLVACEFSDVAGREFRALGHDVTSCDFRPREGSPKHHQGDIRDLLSEYWDAIIAFSPCTRKALSGVQWLKKRDLWADLDAECELFNAIGNANSPRISRENSQPHGEAMKRVGKYSQRLEARWFGEAEKKTVCLWLKGLPPLVVPDKSLWVPKSDCKETVWRMPPGPDREKERSRFFPGIAKAMATQWSNL